MIQTFVIRDKTLDHVLLEHFGSPNTEVCSPTRVYTISNGNNCIWVTEE